MAKDRELQDHERAHSGKPGAKAKHGADQYGYRHRSGRFESNKVPQWIRDADGPEMSDALDWAEKKGVV